MRTPVLARADILARPEKNEFQGESINFKLKIIEVVS